MRGVIRSMGKGERWEQLELFPLEIYRREREIILTGSDNSYTWSSYEN